MSASTADFSAAWVPEHMTFAEPVATASRAASSSPMPLISAKARAATTESPAPTVEPTLTFGALARMTLSLVAKKAPRPPIETTTSSTPPGDEPAGSLGDLGVGGELTADEVGELVIVRLDQRRAGLDADAKRVAVGVKEDLRAGVAKRHDELGVVLGSDALRQAAGDHDDVALSDGGRDGAGQAVGVVRGGLGAGLVDVGVRAQDIVDDLQVRAGLALDRDCLDVDALALEHAGDLLAGAARKDRVGHGFLA